MDSCKIENNNLGLVLPKELQNRHQESSLDQGTVPRKLSVSLWWPHSHQTPGLFTVILFCPYLNNIKKSFTFEVFYLFWKEISLISIFCLLISTSVWQKQAEVKNHSYHGSSHCGAMVMNPIITMRTQIRSPAFFSGSRIQRCCGYCVGWQLQLWFDPWPGNFHVLQVWP